MLRTILEMTAGTIGLLFMCGTIIVAFDVLDALIH
jgi:hypothetical protein